MVPNAWFYKLKDMAKSRSRSRSQIKRKQTSSSSSIFYSSSNFQQHHRKSYYFSRNLSPNNSHQTNVTLSKHIPTSNNIINFSETSSKYSKKRKNIMRRNTSNSPKCVNSSFSSSSSEPHSSLHSPKSMILSPSQCRCNDHILDSVLKIDLPPIITKPKKKGQLKCITVKTEQSTSPKRRISVSSSSIGVKLRTKSPTIVSRKSVGEKSYAVVKSSKDPHRYFKESMVEMIVKNNIKTSKDLEELLACYLSLNSDHYHHLIIKVFKQIWFDIQLK